VGKGPEKTEATTSGRKQKTWRERVLARGEESKESQQTGTLNPL